MVDSRSTPNSFLSLRLPLSPLRLAAFWPALAALATAGLLLGWFLPRLIRQSAASELVQTTSLLAPAAANQIASGTGSSLQNWALSSVRGTTLRLTLIDAAGRVLADSATPAAAIPALENHAARPEVRAAMATGTGSHVRRSDTTGVPYVYAARSVGLPRGGVAVVRLAQPLQDLAAVLHRLFWALGLAALAALAVLGLVSWWLTARVFRPLREVIAGAERLAAGALEHRVPVPPVPEVAALAIAVNRLAGRIGEQVAAAEAERDHLRTILASMSDGVLVTAADGRAVLANTAFRQLFGLGGEVTGSTPLELSRQPVLEHLVRTTVGGGEGESGSIELATPERRTLALTSTPLAEPGGGRGAVVVARDVSAFTRLAETRRDFVANVSHELKTPLAAIRGFAETLRDGALEDPATAQRFTDRILSQCQRLQALLDDLLTLSRLESVSEPAGRADVELGELVRRTLEDAAGAAAEHGLTLSSELEPLPAVPGNADALERLLRNLLENAIKYNRAGGRVLVRLRRRGEHAVLEVTDTGIGIPPEALPRVFERFYRVDPSRARQQGGIGSTGLGLAIVKHVAQSHGGRVEVESEPGRGSTFRVTLPLL